MPLVTTTFNQKTLIRIAMVIAFVQFTNALEYMMFSPVFTFMAADFAVPVSFSGYVSGITHLEPSCRELSPFTGLTVAIRNVF